MVVMMMVLVMMMVVTTVVVVVNQFSKALEPRTVVHLHRFYPTSLKNCKIVKNNAATSHQKQKH